MNEVDLSVQIFGAFRDAVPSGRMTVKARLPISVSDLKALLREELRGKNSPVDLDALLKVSAVATEEQVFQDNETLQSETSIALLPPVCGG